MKRIILIALICGFTFTCFSQKFVIKRVDSDSISYEAGEIIRTVNAQFNICKDLTDRAKFSTELSDQIDSLHHENVWDGYLIQLNNIRLLVVDQFKVNDTTYVTQIGDEYYLNHDTLGLSISERKLVLKNRYQRLVKKYGQDKVDGDKRGVAIRDEHNLLVDYETQLQSQ